MNSIGIIGSTGFVGSTIRQHFDFNLFYGRNNLNQLINQRFDLLVCAAPTGNRIEVQNNCIIDLESTLYLIDHLRKAKPDYFVLIGTVDAVAKPNSRYGLNRKILEGWVKSNLTNYSIIRLPILIHPNLKKNILFDIKNNLYTEKINLDTVNQYYDLTKLHQDIKYAIKNKIKELNLVSEPISNREIIENFPPQSIIGQTPGPVQYYNIEPYHSSKQEIFESMRKYFNEHPVHLW